MLKNILIYIFILMSFGCSPSSLKNKIDNINLVNVSNSDYFYQSTLRLLKSHNITMQPNSQNQLKIVDVVWEQENHELSEYAEAQQIQLVLKVTYKFSNANFEDDKEKVLITYRDVEVSPENMLANDNLIQDTKTMMLQDASHILINNIHNLS